ncbi:MAG: NADH-quinone oxidoreductase subunit K [Desulfurococcales archaeon]|nr:NADH-quinone oxidoreductase subunit K [Desulfurococcales archaeon]
MNAEALSAEVFVIGLTLAAIGAYGVASTRNLLRILLSIEVIFNSVLLLFVAALSALPALSAAFSIFLVSVVSAEVIVVVAVLVAYYRVARSFDSTSLEEGGV